MASDDTIRLAVETALRAHIDRGEVAGAVAAVAHAGRQDVVAVGCMAFEGAPMRSDAVFRIASLTKPVAAAATMCLVEDGVLRLDEPVRNWLPELARPRVLTSLDAPLDRTVPAARPILLRHLLTMTFGTGAVLAPPGRYPIQVALAENGLEPGPDPIRVSPEVWLARLAALPLIHQPGATFMYHTGFDALGVLLARASGQSLSELFTERIFTPLGMTDTAFWVPPDDLQRLPAAYATDPYGWGLIAYDEADDSRWADPPPFESAGGGLVATIGDYLAFTRMLLREGEGVLTSESVAAMSTDALTAAQRDSARVFLGRSSSWGLGVEVNRTRTYPWMTPGRFGWSGGLGTTAYIDPARDVIGVLMTQRLMDSPEPSEIARSFWKALYAAL